MAGSTSWFLWSCTLLPLAGCQYGPSFADCTIACSSATGCPNGLTCGTQGYCLTESRSSCNMPQDAEPPIDDAIDSSVDAGGACQVTGCSDPAFVCVTTSSLVFGQCVPNYTQLPEDCTASASIGKGRNSEAPAIWRVQFVRGNNCSPDQQGYQLTVDYFDPTGNGPTAPSSGTVMRADFGFANPLNLTAAGFAITGTDGISGTLIGFPCINAAPVPASIAFRIIDDVGRQSNTVCLTP